VAVLSTATLVLAAPAQAASGKTYTLSAVKAHRSAGNCWSVVNGKVYNLTKWIKRHPGGAGVIKSMCGRDATAAFKGQHGLTGKPMNTLAAYRVGTLAKSKTSPSPSPTAATLNAALVAKHGTASDCWSIVNGNVYNLTAWIGLHAGGAGVIQAMCGIDGSAAFTGQHGTAPKPASKLALYLVGSVGSPAP
jgi:cytochrome b involved in lipid metabolism